MRYFFYTVFCLFYFQISAFTQTETTGWVNGYIVTLEGDTLRGQLFNRDTEITPKTVQYRPAVQTAATSYSITNLKAFYLQPSDDLFIRQILLVDKTPHLLQNLQNNSNLVLEQDTIFLQRLISGNASLYYQKEQSGKEHFWLKTSDKNFEELILVRYRNSNNDIQKQERYKQQLYLIAEGCESLRNKLKWLSFSTKDLKQFINELNYCHDSSLPQLSAKKSKPLRIDFGILLGATKAVLDISAPSSFYGQPASKNLLTDSKPRISGGLWVNIFLPSNRQQWSLCNELTYQAYKAQYSRTTTQTIPDLLMDTKYLRLFTAIRWQLPGASRVQPYLMFGIVNSMALSLQTSSRIGERKYEQALAGAAGIKFLNFFVEIRHDRGNGMSNLETISTATRTTGLFAGMKF